MRKVRLSSRRARPKYYILQVESYTGRDTTRDQHEILDEEGWNFREISALYVIVRIAEDGASIADDGYRSVAEVKQAWPEAIAPSLSSEESPAGRKHEEVKP